jgi:hypothetical protein
LAALCSLAAAAALIVPTGPAEGIQIDVATQYTPQQRHAAVELGYALGVELNMYENPPVCMRMRSTGQIVAEVFGRDQRARVRRAFAAIHVKATLRVTSIAAFNAGVRRLARTLIAAEPARFKHVRIGYLQIDTLAAGGDLDFEPQCPFVSISRPTRHAKPGLLGEEDAWVEGVVRRYGGDRVQSSCCDAERGRPKLATAARRAHASCGPPGAHTVKLSPTIRVYRVPTHNRLAPDLEYACWRHGGRASLRLGFAGSFGWNAAHTTLLKLAPQTGSEPSSVIAWVQRTEGTHQSMSLRSGDVRTGKLIHQTAPPGTGDTISALERGYFIVTPAGSLAWYGKGGPVDGHGEHTGPEGVWRFDAQGEHLLAAGEWIAKPLRWSAGILYWTIEGPALQATPLQ